MNLAAGVSTKKLYRNAHLTLERAPRLGVADMNATMTARRGLRVAELDAAVGVSADRLTGRLSRSGHSTRSHGRCADGTLNAVRLGQVWPQEC